MPYELASFCYQGVEHVNFLRTNSEEENHHAQHVLEKQVGIRRELVGMRRWQRGVQMFG